MRSKDGYKRVLLLVPGYKKSHYEYVGVPAGVGYISEDMEKMFNDLEIPSVIRRILAKVYYARESQTYVIDSGLASKVKRFLKLKRRAVQG